jgi:hypothetical protein
MHLIAKPYHHNESAESEGAKTDFKECRPERSELDYELIEGVDENASHVLECNVASPLPSVPPPSAGTRVSFSLFHPPVIL